MIRFRRLSVVLAGCLLCLPSEHLLAIPFSSTNVSHCNPSLMNQQALSARLATASNDHSMGASNYAKIKLIRLAQQFRTKILVRRAITQIVGNTPDDKAKRFAAEIKRNPFLLDAYRLEDLLMDLGVWTVVDVVEQIHRFFPKGIETEFIGVYSANIIPDQEPVQIGSGNIDHAYRSKSAVIDTLIQRLENQYQGRSFLPFVQAAFTALIQVVDHHQKDWLLLSVRSGEKSKFPHAVDSVIGGRVGVGESLAKAGTREFEEEVGSSLRPISILEHNFKQTKNDGTIDEQTHVWTSSILLDEDQGAMVIGRLKDMGHTVVRADTVEELERVMPDQIRATHGTSPLELTQSVQADSQERKETAYFILAPIQIVEQVYQTGRGITPTVDTPAGRWAWGENNFIGKTSLIMKAQESVRNFIASHFHEKSSDIWTSLFNILAPFLIGIQFFLGPESGFGSSRPIESHPMIIAA